MTTPFADALRAALQAPAAAPLLVHADVFRARAAIAPTTNPQEMLARHLAALEHVAGGRPLWLPCFHYDYPKTRLYRPAVDASQVGALTEHARTGWAAWRRGAPIFNIVGRGPEPCDLPESGSVDPFGRDSLFGRLHAAGSEVLLYGTGLGSLTAIHYIERLAGGPAYRYDKRFPGRVERPGQPARDVTLLYHCRPMGQALEYDWARLDAEARAAGVLQAVPGGSASVVRLPALVELWRGRLAADPLHLLDAPSRAWVAPLLDRLGRRFELADFE